jgi:uncharacterized Zn finger protein
MNRELDVECRWCSPDKRVTHDVLRAGRKFIVRCMACQNIEQMEPLRRASSFKVKVIVSDYDLSHLAWFEVGCRELLHLGDELIVENGSTDAVRITAIELRDGARKAEAVAESIRTLWAQRIDKVVVKIAVHTGKTTRSLKVPCNGADEFVVGSEQQLGKITGIKLRHGAMLSRRGQSALAKDIQRMYVEGAAVRRYGRVRQSVAFRKSAWRR